MEKRKYKRKHYERKWNQNACYELALTCRGKREMKLKNAQAYKKAKENGWINDYDWFIDGRKLAAEKRTIWTFEKAYEEAKQYNTIKDLRENNPKLYDACLQHRYLEKFDFLSRHLDIFRDKKDNVYVYVFEESKTVYVGRTINPLERDYNHRSSKKSAVCRFAVENNQIIPKMEILKKGLTPFEGLEWENYYVNKYKEEGWILLNRAKTGKTSGSLGGLKQK